MSSHCYNTRNKGNRENLKSLTRSKRNRNKNVHYNEASPDPAPTLKYRNTTKEHVRELSLPELHDDGKYWVCAFYCKDPEPEYLLIPNALNKFMGNIHKKHISYKKWLVSLFGSKWISKHLQSIIKDAIYVDIVPEYPLNIFCYFLDGDLPIELRYVLITGYNNNMKTEFDNMDNHLTYFVHHVDIRKDTLTMFNKQSGKEFDLTRPTGLVSKHQILPITSSKYVGDLDVSLMECRVHYLQLLSESRATESQAAIQMFASTVIVLIEGAGVRTRGTLYKRNEGNVKSFTFPVPPAAFDAALHSKFGKIKKIKSTQTFFVKGTSTYYIFNTEQAGIIYGDKNINRDYDENGKEIFPPNDDEDEDVNMENEDVLSYTMSVGGLMIRHCRSSKKVTFTHNIVRVNDKGQMTGQTTSFWKKFAQEFDYKDFGIKKEKNEELN